MIFWCARILPRWKSPFLYLSVPVCTCLYLQEPNDIEW